MKTSYYWFWSVMLGGMSLAADTENSSGKITRYKTVVSSDDMEWRSTFLPANDRTPFTASYSDVYGNGRCYDKQLWESPLVEFVYANLGLHKRYSEVCKKRLSGHAENLNDVDGFDVLGGNNDELVLKWRNIKGLLVKHKELLMTEAIFNCKVFVRVGISEDSYAAKTQRELCQGFDGNETGLEEMNMNGDLFINAISNFVAGIETLQKKNYDLEDAIDYGLCGHPPRGKLATEMVEIRNSSDELSRAQAKTFDDLEDSVNQIGIALIELHGIYCGLIDRQLQLVLLEKDARFSDAEIKRIREEFKPLKYSRAAYGVFLLLKPSSDGKTYMRPYLKRK